MEKIQQLLSKVEVLPPSPTLLPKLLPALSDVDNNFDEVVEIIALDPSLTAKLLQICNSAFFGMENPVTSVSEAVSQVGYQSVYLLVAMISGSGCFPCPAPAGVDPGRLWRHSITTAYNAKFVAESAGEDDNLLFTAGLLHDIGKVVLGQIEPLKMVSYMYVPFNATVAVHEQLLFGCTHAEVGAALLENWKLPEPIVAGVRWHHNPGEATSFQRVAACVALGNLLTHSTEHSELLERDDFKAGLALLDLSPDTIRIWRDKLRDQQSLIDSMSKLPV